MELRATQAEIDTEKKRYNEDPENALNFVQAKEGLFLRINLEGYQRHIPVVITDAKGK